MELCIPVSALYDEFVCPICLSPVTDAYITPCGHNACNGCLQEWISRKHTCPVCVAPDITVPRLVKNIGFDNLYLKVCTHRVFLGICIHIFIVSVRKVCEERTKASAKYFKGLTAGGTSPASSSSLLLCVTTCVCMFVRSAGGWCCGRTLFTLVVPDRSCVPEAYAGVAVWVHLATSRAGIKVQPPQRGHRGTVLRKD